jgi:16S rRNA (cytidine1402-2'-O)-methyltransferase
MTTGTLYIVASPIGNLEDITLRALRILKESADFIYCEDTRYTKILLNAYDIKASLQSFHAHSSDKKIDTAVKQLEEGKNIAYLTDSGTPGISDPGSRLVRAARSKGIQVVPIPGPSALTTLVSASGFMGKNILFLGFPGKKDGKIRKELTQYKDFKGTIILYESPYRIKKLIPLIHEIFPTSEMVIGREMTKMYEEFIAGQVETIYNNMNFKEMGEFCLAIFTEKF